MWNGSGEESESEELGMGVGMVGVTPTSYGSGGQMSVNRDKMTKMGEVNHIEMGGLGLGPFD